ncbi:MAG TPA: CdaR family protein [Anaerolineales bacterium]|nr:CdaR family protein [Anaerolineales bacterium]
MVRWLNDNFGSLLLALVASALVWASAVSAADPIQEQALPDRIPIVITGLAEDLVLVGEPPGEGAVTIRAPRSVWERLTAGSIHLEVDLNGMPEAEGSPCSSSDMRVWTCQVPLAWRTDLGPARVTEIEPASLTLTLEPLATDRVPVQVRTLGTPAVGYRVLTPGADPDEVIVSGPASAVDRVAQALAEVSLSGQRQAVDQIVQLLPVDPSGQSVPGVRVEPAEVRVTAQVEQLGGYRDVAVKVIIEGQVEPGYWVTSITVSPPVITVYSADAEAVVVLPGFVETEPLVLTGASSNLSRRLALDLPAGVSPVGDQTVLVEVGIAAIESSLTLTRQLETQGLGAGLYAVPSPDTVSVIISGPLPVLERLTLSDVRVVLDLRDRGVGTHQVTPEVILLPSGLVAQAILPATIEVSITRTPPPTPTARP